MKKIEDYLHLYLGCPCKWKIAGEDEWHEPDSSIDLKVLDRVYDRQPFVIAPILRPLSWLDTLEGNLMRDKYHGLKHRFSNGDIIDTPESFKFLLDNHFDLFNLIPEGLALASPTPQNNKK